jgi:hypothetical protein
MSSEDEAFVELIDLAEEMKKLFSQPQPHSQKPWVP